MSGPLTGLRVVELAGIGAVPHAAMVLGDLGADVVRVERPARVRPGAGPPRLHVAQPPVGGRGPEVRRRPRAGAAPGSQGGRAAGRAPARCGRTAGCRPAAVPRGEPGAGLRPDDRLGPGRADGRAGRARHQLHLAHRRAARDRGRGPAAVPLNLVGDYGGGSMFLATGCSPRSASGSGPAPGRWWTRPWWTGPTCCPGGVGAARRGAWTDDRAANLLDGGAPFYDTYTCADGRWIAVGALEPQFYAQFLAGLGIAGEDLPEQMDRSGWPRLRARFTEVIASRSRDEWSEIFAGTDACVTPVLSFGEAARAPHTTARDSVITLDGIPRAAPAPRFSRTPAGTPSAPPLPGGDTAAVLADWDA